MTNRQTKTAISLAFMITGGLALKTSIALATLFVSFTLLSWLSYRLYTTVKTELEKAQSLVQTNITLTEQINTITQQLTQAQTTYTKNHCDDAAKITYLENQCERLKLERNNALERIKSLETALNITEAKRAKLVEAHKALKAQPPRL